MSGRAVAQHLDPLDHVGRNEIKVRGRLAILRRAVDEQGGAVVPPLAVYQHEQMVARQAAQRQRLDRETRARAAVGDIDGGDQRAKQVADRLPAIRLQIARGHYVDWRHAVGDGAGDKAGAGDDDRRRVRDRRRRGRSLAQLKGERALPRGGAGRGGKRDDPGAGLRHAQMRAGEQLLQRLPRGHPSVDTAAADRRHLLIGKEDAHAGLRGQLAQRAAERLDMNVETVPLIQYLVRRRIGPRGQRRTAKQHKPGQGLNEAHGHSPLSPVRSDGRQSGETDGAAATRHQGGGAAARPIV